MDKRKRQKRNLQAWAKGKPEYENIFTEWDKAYEDWRPYSKHRVYMNEGIYGSPLIMFAGSLLQLEKALVGTRRYSSRRKEST
jgi:hypothetical protein